MSYADKSIWLHLSILRNELTGKSLFIPQAPITYHYKQTQQFK